MSGAFEALSGVLKARSGLILGPDKQYLLETRLAPMLRRESLRDLRALADRVLSAPNGPLERELVEAMTTGETLFFRDDKPFVHLRDVALPRLHAARAPGAPLRFWSAAASSGQEAYSLAMLMADAPAALRRPVRILGTDLSREKIDRARAGLYNQFEVQRGLTPPMLAKHFTAQGTSWRISDALRAVVEFRSFNLLDDLAPLGTFDVVFCRNVLIYFDAPTKTRVLDAVARRLAPDGVLYLGGAESVMGLTDRLVAMPCGRGVYRPA
jgi:chemotaxis protein methyltransferase CheR